MRKLSDQWAMFGGFFVFVGVIILLNGLSHAAGTVWMAVADSIEATGVYIEDDSGEKHIQYEANGHLYRIECAIGGGAGEEVKVRYLLDNPGAARMTDLDKWGLYVSAGAVFSAVGMAFMSAMIKNHRLLKSLLKDGIRVQAQIDEIECGSFPPKWRKCYRVQASMKHPAAGRWVKVSSGWLLDHPGKRLTDGTVTVLADPLDENRYYVMLERGEMTGYKKIKVNSEYWGNR